MIFVTITIIIVIVIVIVIITKSILRIIKELLQSFYLWFHSGDISLNKIYL